MVKKSFNWIALVAVIALVVAVVALGLVINSNCSTSQVLDEESAYVEEPQMAPVSPTCTDTDGGKNYNLAGNVTGRYVDGSFYRLQDRCNSETLLIEEYCLRNVPLPITHTCITSRERCWGRACLHCFDPDGENYNSRGTVQGTVNWVENGVVKSAQDYCSTATGRLVEWFCNPSTGTSGTISIPCPSGYTCNDLGPYPGRCRQQ